MKQRSLRDLPYEQVARSGKAVSTPKQLVLLAQGEERVDVLVTKLSAGIKLNSDHPKAFRGTRLSNSWRDEKYVVPCLTGSEMAGLWATLQPDSAVVKAGDFANSQADVLANSIDYAWTGWSAPLQFDREGICFLENRDALADLGKGNIYAVPTQQLVINGPVFSCASAKFCTKNGLYRDYRSPAPSHNLQFRGTPCSSSH